MLFMSGVYNTLKDKPCVNTSVDIVAEQFPLKTAVYHDSLKNAV